jgi:Flp pilus assembly secretin CpaC
MLHFLPRFAGLTLTLAFFLAVPAGTAQDSVTGKAADSGDKAKVERLIYNVQRGSANEIAKILANQFKGSAEIDTLPENFGNCLLIRGPAGEVEEVRKLLGAIDRKPQTIAVEILFAEVPPKKEDAAKEDGTKTNEPVKELEPKQFTGPVEAVLANVRASTNQGRITGLRRARITLLENVPSTVALTENKPVVSGIHVTATGFVSKNITYQQAGAQAKVTARVRADNRIDLDVESAVSRLEPDPAVSIGNDEKGNPVPATASVHSRFANKLSLTSGNAVAADNVVKTARGEGVRNLVIVTAKIIDPNAVPEKEDIPNDSPLAPGRRPRRERPQSPPPPPASIQ